MIYFTLLTSNLAQVAKDLISKAFPENQPIPMPWDDFPLDVAVLPVSWSFREETSSHSKA
jgi:hypothetical protein